MYLFESGAVMAGNIEKIVRETEKFYFETDSIGQGGMGRVYKMIFNPYLYYNEILKDGNDYLNAAKIFEEQMSQNQRDDAYLDALNDAKNSNDSNLLNLLERKIIAVKELTLLHDKITPRFEKEIEFLVDPKNRHPNIIQGYGWIKTKKASGIKLLMEYIDAIPIDKLKGKLPIPLSTYIISQISKALEFCHNNDVLHRDVKPANILVEIDRNYQQNEQLTSEEKDYDIINSVKKIKLIDFGLIKSIDDDAPSMTLVGEFFGTPKFYAPECVELGIKNFTKKSEVFTLCASLYDMVCGIAPIQSVLGSGDTSMLSMMNILNITPDFVFPREYNPTISKTLQNIIMMGLAKKPEERPTMGEMKWFLENLLKRRQCMQNELSLEDITKKTELVNKHYAQAQRNSSPSVYWNIADILLQIPGKEEEAIDALTKAQELFKTTNNPKYKGYINMCDKLISVEKRALTAPKRKKN